MKHLNTLKPLLFLISVLALAALACGSSTPDPNQPTATPAPTATPKLSISLEVVNETQTSLCYLLVAPSDEEFDREYLNGVEIAPGTSYTVGGFEAGEYNVKIHDCEKHMVNALYYVEMNQEEMTWTIQEASLEIVNESSRNICELYISPSSAPESAWGPSQLDKAAGEILEPGMYVDFSIANGKWDVRIVPCDETLEPTTEIGLKVEGEYTYTISDN